MVLLRIFTSSIFLFLIIFTIPLAFDVGGRTCGLAFSLSLTTYYFLYSVLRLATPDRSVFRATAGNVIRYTQWFAILALLIWSLNKFSVDSSNGGVGQWVERTFDFKRAADKSVSQWLFGKQGLVESLAISGWDSLLRWSTPVFQVGEGFCSLLVIQAAGQITRYLVNQERGDSWMIGLLVLSGSIISSSIYFLVRLTGFPDIGNVDAILIGAAIMTAIILGAWGIVSGRGNPVESSLLFAYMTLCVYQIFTDYTPSSTSTTPPLPEQPALPPLPPIIMASYTTLIHALETLPSTVQSFFTFVVAAVMTITPSVIISLAYRVCVMYASARIIPAIREGGARTLSQEPSMEDNDAAGQFLGFLSWFSPSILIAVYTSLLMQHFASTSWDGNGDSVEGRDWWTSQGGHMGGNLARWINLWLTMGLYAVELYIGRMDDDGTADPLAVESVIEAAASLFDTPGDDRPSVRKTDTQRRSRRLSLFQHLVDEKCVEAWEAGQTDRLRILEDIRDSKEGLRESLHQLKHRREHCHGAIARDSK